jgi:hypothetical protein
MKVCLWVGAVIVVLLSGCSGNGRPYNSGESKTIPCDESVIKVGLRGLQPPKENDCRYGTPDGVEYNVVQYSRLARFPASIAVLEWLKASHYTYLQTVSLQQALQNYGDVKKYGHGFGDPGRISVSGQDYEIMDFDFKGDIKCTGFLGNGRVSRGAQGHDSRLSGYYCASQQRPSRSKLTKLLESVTISNP